MHRTRRRTHLTRRDELLLRRIREAQAQAADPRRKKRDTVRIWTEVLQRVRPRFPDGFFKDPDRRRWLVVAFVRRWKGRRKFYPTRREFFAARLGSIMPYFRNAPYNAYVDAGFTDPKSDLYDRRLDEEPWCVLRRVPQGYWKSRENRARATQWLLSRLGKDPRDLSAEDFMKNEISGVLNHCANSPYRALGEAGERFEPWEMRVGPRDVWRRRGERRRAVRWLVEKCGGDPEKVSYEDFERFGLTELTGLCGSMYAALVDAGFRIDPLGIRRVPWGFWKSKPNRVRCVRRMVKALGKPPERITTGDFKCFGLYSMLRVAGLNGYEALTEAGYRFPAWLSGKVPWGYWDEVSNRRAAVRWVVVRSGKPVEEISYGDFAAHGLTGLMTRFYGRSPRNALREAGIRGMSLRRRDRP